MKRWIILTYEEKHDDAISIKIDNFVKELKTIDKKIHVSDISRGIE